ncbi:MAG: NAD(P)/FAD-dependent oxidoreductase [Sphingobium sp.]|uniref:flavin-containing monooxygenase n=2 Tax=unclassified Sphingobium TaxID=2611147 RepID=UPI001E3214EC|nr:NAD(P)/FAD-dependent oxidoreductase [Sphingobium sp. CECT 9361]CAH0357085.1 Baeyer-Villiger monooxygenase [Sphingobium sp. CECT 9361]
MENSVGGAMRPGLRKSSRIAILGAGVCGMLMAYRIKEAGFENFVVYEKDDAIGGTWKRHNYPGLCCDVHSHVYSYSFDRNPYWSKMYPERDELLAYFTEFGKKHELMEHVRLSTEVTTATYDEAQGEWTLTIAGSERTETFDYLIAATGFYNEASLPKIRGRERFKGASFHSSHWQQNIDLKGKRVGIVGTAAAAVQIVPAIYPEVGELKIFQRTPSWIVPRNNVVYSEEQQREFAQDTDSWRKHRDELYEFSKAFLDSVSGNPEKLEELRSVCLAYLQEQIADPVLRAKLTPDFDPGCKRLLITGDYYKTVANSNVDIVTDSIESMDESGIVTGDGTHHDLDVVIWCTGYKMPNYHGPVHTTGLDGKALEDVWSDLPQAFRSVSVPGFPNYFMVNGPNGIFGHSSAIHSAEISTEYIIRLIEAAEEMELKSINVRQDVFKEYNKSVQEYFKDTTFNGNCDSFYHDEKHRVWFFYPGDHIAMETELRSTTLEDFDVVR